MFQTSFGMDKVVGLLFSNILLLQCILFILVILKTIHFVNKMNNRWGLSDWFYFGQGSLVNSTSEESVQSKENTKPVICIITCLFYFRYVYNII